VDLAPSAPAPQPGEADVRTQKRNPPGTRHAARLKAKLKAAPEDTPESTRIRLHRAISWLTRAEAEADDPDARFVFLWIAFNAAYARELGFEKSARDQLAEFFAQLLSFDRERRLAGLTLERFSGPIRTLVANRYVFEPFWKALREHDSSDRWERKLTTSHQRALRAVLEGDTGCVLSVVFDRLYVLRNQLVHGGATWSGRVNRAQVRDGTNLLLAIVPGVVDLMLDHPDADFGEILYPVLER
jgi:hypothetical protein